jgi:hypothetical protein
MRGIVPSRASEFAPRNDLPPAYICIGTEES